MDRATYHLTGHGDTWMLVVEAIFQIDDMVWALVVLVLAGLCFQRSATPRLSGLRAVGIALLMWQLTAAIGWFILLGVGIGGFTYFPVGDFLMPVERLLKMAGDLLGIALYVLAAVGVLKVATDLSR